MSRLKELRAFINKAKFHYSSGQVNPYEFHKTFYYMCKIFCVVESENIPKWAIILPISVIVTGTIASILCFMSLLHNITTFIVPFITESGTYFIIMVYKLLIISCTFTDKVHYRNFLCAMKDDFEYICSSKGNKYRVKYFENHLFTWKASLLSSIFVFFLASSMVFSANIALFYFLLHPAKDGDRPLPFPYWAFDLDFTKTPLYEIGFVFFNLCVGSHTVTYIFMMQTQIVWIRQITSKVDIIVWSIEDLLVDIQPTSDMQQKEYYIKSIRIQMADIIKMHHSMYRLLDDYAGVYKKLLMFEQKMCGPVICLTGYCAAEKIDAGENPGIMIMLCTAAITLNYIPSYLNTVLAEKVKSIGYACWDSPFWNAPPTVMRTYFVLIMQRSSRPLSIQAPGFEEVSLQTFSDKVKFAYTCFNMLRQVDY